MDVNNRAHLPPDPGRQLSSHSPNPVGTGKKIPKLRRKKAQEAQQYDILRIDEQIQTAFATEQLKIPELTARIVSMTQALFRTPMPFGIDEKIQEDIRAIISTNQTVPDLPSHSSKNETSDQISLTSEPRLDMTYQGYLEFYSRIKGLILRRQNLELDKFKTTYCRLVQPILDEYRKILSTPLKTTFLSSSKIRNESDSEKRKKELIDSYLRIASNFVSIDYTPEQTKPVEIKYSCQCGNNNDFETREGLIICEQCGVETETTTTQSSFKDIDRINTHTRYKYEKSFHFREAIAMFQGKQNKYIDPGIYERIEEWCKRHNLLDLDATATQEQYAKVTKAHLRIMFYESKDKTLTDHHEDIHLIYSKITGRPCADISHLEEKFNGWFDLIEQAFYESPDIDRTNILNGPFVLKKFLRMCNYPVSDDDFPGLKTLTRQQDHEVLFSYLCQKAGLNDPDNSPQVKRRLAKVLTRVIKLQV